MKGAGGGSEGKTSSGAAQVRTVVVVDDDDALRDLVVRILSSWGYEVVGEAATVADALACVADRRPQVVLADVGLPDGDGFALAAALGQLDDPPVVVLMSSDSDASYAQWAARVGAAGFVPKADLGGEELRRLLAGG